MTTLLVVEFTAGEKPAEPICQISLILVNSADGSRPEIDAHSGE